MKISLLFLVLLSSSFLLTTQAIEDRPNVVVIRNCCKWRVTRPVTWASLINSLTYAEACQPFGDRIDLEF